MGAGVVALARTERERRAAARGRRSRGISLLDDELPAPGLLRVLVGQLDTAIELLEGYPGESRERTVHETRKALKRARAIARVLREQLDPQRLARERGALRDCARHLAGARDAVVMVNALEGILKDHPKLVDPHARGAEGVRALREQLRAERDAAVAGATGASAEGDPERSVQELERAEIARHRAVAFELRAIRVRVLTWDLSEPRDPGKRAGAAGQPMQLAGGLERLYRQGRRRMRRARRRELDVGAMHAWRKSVKDMRYVAEALSRRDSTRAGREERRLRRVARRADRLGELLGEEHDLALLAEVVRVHAGGFDGRRRGHRALLKAIARRRRRLRGRALRKGERLYERGPRSFVKRVRGAL